MKVDLFDFDLPSDRIALRPAEPRESARLLEVRAAGLGHFRIADLPGLLRPGDMLVVNDTRVIPARLKGRRGEANVQATLHMRIDGCTWAAFARPAKRFRPGDRIDFGGALSAEVVERRDGGEVVLRFDRADDALLQALHAAGEMPLPPYIASKRPVDARDLSDYQTVMADRPGAVAAPTAGLHLTEALFTELAARDIAVHRLTLHVGAGTFLPVKADDTADHRMHAEVGEIADSTAEALNRGRAEGGRIVAVGTTSLRLLESAVDAAGDIRAFSGATDIFITPGHRFRTADMLLTNFHLPRSTLFMLVSAFSGLERMKAAYAEAIGRDYRFYSYGDACLLHRVEP
ncbi:MAG: tRNA preQ1(34) S-adenosylmethionine ribosyltransferase-isomerase QueA [Rhizobiales bacterium NRL2]|nr:MAG: tRNA preQ1(34) S-adenosylmethionine ribosyltransferase-isomerase QueA [Rhizobiales bacterium NRL2]